jgi:hypothetical protein
VTGVQTCALPICVRYLRNWLISFYPERFDIVKQVEQMAMDLGEQLGPPCLSWKYSWVKEIFGWHLAKRVQVSLRKTRWQGEKLLDKTLFHIEKGATRT